jgi:hypothetical protein
VLNGGGWKGSQHRKHVCRIPLYSPGLTLRLEEGEDVVNADGALDVTDDGTRGVVHELDADLGDTTTRAGAAEDL